MEEIKRAEWDGEFFKKYSCFHVIHWDLEGVSFALTQHSQVRKFAQKEIISNFKNKPQVEKQARAAHPPVEMSCRLIYKFTTKPRIEFLTWITSLLTESI